MEKPKETTEGRPRAQPMVPVRQDFLFVDAAQAKTSRQGRRNARSFVMQKARRERPWSTSKNVAKHKKGDESISPRSAGTLNSSVTPTMVTASRPIYPNRPDYFTSLEHQPYLSVNEFISTECHILLCRPGESRCLRCLSLKPISPEEGPSNNLFDPFRSSSVEIDSSVSELMEHCK